ncbi:MAG TPA: hypothetical protein PLQ67_02620 [Burkholderiaceae bacterium]|nr:hypothetical protein [Burkholderiaceae bacterium]
MNTGLFSKIIHVPAKLDVPFRQIFDAPAMKGPKTHTFSQLQFSGGKLQESYVRQYVSEIGGERGYAIPERLPGWLPEFRQQVDRSKDSASIFRNAKDYEGLSKSPTYARLKLAGGSPRNPIDNINHPFVAEVVQPKHAQYFKERIELGFSLISNWPTGSERLFTDAHGNERVLRIHYDKGSYHEPRPAEGSIFATQGVAYLIEEKIENMLKNMVNNPR